MSVARLNGKAYHQEGGGATRPPSSRKRKPRDRGKKQMQHHPPQHHLPTWVYPLLINVGVMLVTAGISYGLLQGDISSIKIKLNLQDQVVATQSQRIDALMREQERITRLEENLKNIANLLGEIREDLRSGRYSITPRKQ